MLDQDTETDSYSEQCLEEPVQSYYVPKLNIYS